MSVMFSVMIGFFGVLFIVMLYIRFRSMTLMFSLGLMMLCIVLLISLCVGMEVVVFVIVIFLFWVNPLLR